MRLALLAKNRKRFHGMKKNLSKFLEVVIFLLKWVMFFTAQFIFTPKGVDWKDYFDFSSQASVMLLTWRLFVALGFAIVSTLLTRSLMSKKETTDQTSEEQSEEHPQG